MKLVSVTLHDIRRFSRPVHVGGIAPGLNILSAQNESGKSTLFDALLAVFLQPHRSGSAEIRSLKPHAGGSPRAEVEVDLPAGRFRIVKQWLKSPTAEVWHGDRLTAKADAAEAWIAALSPGGHQGGPAGLLWVRQGETALDLGSKTDRDAARAVRRDLMSSIAGEVATVTGGRRMDRVLEKAREELASIASQSGRASKKTRLALAESEVEALAARAHALQRISEDLGGAIIRRRQVQKMLGELQDPALAAERRARLDQTMTAQAAAQRHAEERGRAEEALAAAGARQDDSVRALAALKDAQAAVAATAGAARDAARAFGDATAARSAAEARCRDPFGRACGPAGCARRGRARLA